MDPRQILKCAHSILVIDWPSKDVPESLARAGFHVIAKGGPGPEDYSAYEVDPSGKVVVRRTGRAPDRVDLVYSHRPIAELPGIVEQAKSLQATAVWTQSGLSVSGVRDPKGCWLPEDEFQRAQNLVRTEGLHYIAQPYIADVARQA